MSKNVLVIPTVSSGNIPQLTVDLLLHTLNAQIVARLDDQYMYPFAGPVDSSDDGAKEVATGGLTTAGDVYKAGDITLIQLRSPTLPGYRERFVKETILPFIKAGNFSDVLVVGSSNPALRKQVGDSKFQYFSESLADQLSGLSLGGNNVQPIPESLPESGILVDVLKQVPNSCGIVMFAYEGDNFGDAESLADQVAGLLNLQKDQKNWLRPQSWKGIYGKDVPVGMEEGLYS